MYNFINVWRRNRGLNWFGTKQKTSISHGFPFIIFCYVYGGGTSTQITPRHAAPSEINKRQQQGKYPECGNCHSAAHLRTLPASKWCLFFKLWQQIIIYTHSHADKQGWASPKEIFIFAITMEWFVSACTSKYTNFFCTQYYYFLLHVCNIFN